MSRKKAAASPEPSPQPARKPLFAMKDLKSPPLVGATALKVVELLHRVCDGEILQSPISEPMPSIGARCHELRLSDEAGEWRAIYQTHHDHVLLVDWFHKKSNKTSKADIERCRKRVKSYVSKVGKPKGRAEDRGEKKPGKPEGQHDP